MDCTKLTDNDLMDAYRAVHAEVDRRQQYRQIPAQIAAMTTQYVADGGKRADLATAVQQAPEPSEKATPPPAADPAPSGAGSSGTTSGSGGATVGVKVG